jgi:hypothetical protein
MDVSGIPGSLDMDVSGIPGTLEMDVSGISGSLDMDVSGIPGTLDMDVSGISGSLDIRVQLGVPASDIVELDVGGVRYTTSLATLRSRPGSMLHAMFSGHFQIEEEEGDGAFIDRDGSVFGHVLAYLRDGVVAVGCERDIPMLERLKCEFDFYCIDPIIERTVVLAVGDCRVKAYDIDKERWQASVPMPALVGRFRHAFGTCVLRGMLYVTGGEEDFDILSTVHRFSPSSNTWCSVASMPEARSEHDACEVDGANGEPSSMYVVGGYHKQTWKYDAENDKWSEVAPLPVELRHSATCSIGSDMYVIGGRNSRSIAQSDVYKYSAVNNIWITVSPMPTVGINIGACVVGGMIYVVGGQDADHIGTMLSSVFRYDPLSDTWTAVASMSHARGNPSVYALYGCVYAAGGYDGRQSRSVVEKYDPTLDRWSAVPSMTVPRNLMKTTAWKVEENMFDVMIRQARSSLQ